MSGRKPRNSSTWHQQIGSASEYLGLGLQLAGSVLVYVGVGFLVDWWLDTSPTFLVVGAVLGMVAFFLQLVRVVRRLNAESARRPRGEPGSREDTWEDDAWERDAWKSDSWEDDAWDREDWGRKKDG